MCVLNYGFIVLLLLEKFVAVLLDDFTDDFSGEFGPFGHALRDIKVRLLDQGVDGFVVTHRIDPDKFAL